VKSKAGVLGLTRELAVEWAPRGVQVVALAPGFFRSDQTIWAFERNKELGQRVTRRHFFERIADGVSGAALATLLNRDVGGLQDRLDACAAAAVRRRFPRCAPGASLVRQHGASWPCIVNGSNSEPSGRDIQATMI